MRRIEDGTVRVTLHACNGGSGLCYSGVAVFER